MTDTQEVTKAVVDLLEQAGHAANQAAGVAFPYLVQHEQAQGLALLLISLPLIGLGGFSLVRGIRNLVSEDPDDCIGWFGLAIIVSFIGFALFASALPNFLAPEGAVIKDLIRMVTR